MRPPVLRTKDPNEVQIKVEPEQEKRPKMIAAQQGPCLNIRYGDMDLRSAEILHHYATIVCLNIAGPKVVHIWKVTIPHMALEHRFLMHGILALSAMHLSQLIPQRKTDLVTFAAASEHLALPPFRSFIAKQKLEAEQLHAVFAFSHFVVPYMLASGQPHWFHALRGYMAFLTKCWNDLEKGPLGYQLVRNPLAPGTARDHPEDVHLAKIHEILQPRAESSPEERGELEVCRAALEELRELWSGPYMVGKMAIVAIIYLWPSKVSDDYITLMHKHRPGAIIILAHYALLVKRMNMLWYLRGVGHKLLSAIDAELGDEYKPYVEWAMNEPMG
jgi:hypothetical protein